MIAVGKTTAREAAREYIRKKFVPIPVPRASKAPQMKGWVSLRLNDIKLDFFAEDGNVGLLLGDASNGLVDIDLDTAEATRLATTFLPATTMVHGRLSRRSTHRWYIVNPAPEPLKFTDPDGTCLVELRSNNQFTLVPPSCHPNGETLEWEELGDPSKVSAVDLQHRVARLAAAALIARHWPKPGSRHEAANALAGLLLRTNWTAEEAITFIGEVARVAGDEEHAARADDVRSTAKRLSDKGVATGRTRLTELFGNQIVNLACKWLQIKSTIWSATSQEPVNQHYPEPLDAEAFHGLAGEIVRTLDPHTEADPAALLIQILVAFGNVIGPGPHFVVEGDIHLTNLFAVLVGTTSKGRKGSAWSHVRRLFKVVDKNWADNCLKSGMSSGEGLIWAVRDAINRQDPIKEKGRVIDYESIVVDPGVADKRLTVIEPEFASPLRLVGCEGNTLSPMIRQAWESGDLRILTKHSPAQATGALISIIGHITRDEVLRYLSVTEAANGFANRFLWMCVRRSKILPEGGQLENVDLRPLTDRLSDAIAYARTVGRMSRDEESRKTWRQVYPKLSEGKPGLFGAVISRAEAQVTRLACIYALLDRCSEIQQPHLLAALAIWDYAEASAQFIFGRSMGDPVADELIRSLRSSPAGLTRTQIRDLFDRHRSAAEIGRALEQLAEYGLALCSIEDSGGRPVERWRATNATEATKPGPQL